MSDLDCFWHTTESFSEFWTELKRRFELARNKSTKCNDHQNCNSCLDGFIEEEVLSLIYNRVNDQKIRHCIDMLANVEYTLEKYLYLGETQELSKANAEGTPRTRAKVKVKGQVNHAHVVVTDISMANVRQKASSVRSEAN